MTLLSVLVAFRNEDAASLLEDQGLHFIPSSVYLLIVALENQTRSRWYEVEGRVLDWKSWLNW